MRYFRHPVFFFSPDTPAPFDPLNPHQIAVPSLHLTLHQLPLNWLLFYLSCSDSYSAP